MTNTAPGRRPALTALLGAAGLLAGSIAEMAGHGGAAIWPGLPGPAGPDLAFAGGVAAAGALLAVLLLPPSLHSSPGQRVLRPAKPDSPQAPVHPRSKQSASAAGYPLRQQHPAAPPHLTNTEGNTHDRTDQPPPRQ